jgi:hypothetical protein
MIYKASIKRLGTKKTKCCGGCGKTTGRIFHAFNHLIQLIAYPHTHVITRSGVRTKGRKKVSFTT